MYRRDQEEGTLTSQHIDFQVQRFSHALVHHDRCYKSFSGYAFMVMGATKPYKHARRLLIYRRSACSACPSGVGMACH